MRSKDLERLLLGVSVGLAALFAALGVWVAMGWPPMAETFEAWGYPHGMRVGVGIFQLLVAGMLVVRQSAFYGAALVIALSIGAIFNMLLHGQGPMATSWVLVSLLALFVAWGRQPRTPVEPPDRWERI